MTDSGSIGEISGKNLVAYDSIAEAWARQREQSSFRERVYVDRWLHGLPAGAQVLDLGCGTGVPITRYLLDAGYRVTGVDQSPEMLLLMAKTCPEARRIQSEITEFEPKRAFDALVAWDCLFHLPRDHHLRVFRAMVSWLRPGAPALLSLGGSEDEFESKMLGVNLFYSGFSPQASIDRLIEAGFEILLQEVDDPSSRGHFVVLCRKPFETVAEKESGR